MFGVARRDLYKFEILHAKMNHERAIARERGGKEGEGGCIGTRDRARLTFILRQGVLQLRRRRKRREEGQRRLRTSNHGKLNSVAPSASALRDKMGSHSPVAIFLLCVKFHHFIPFIMFL